MARINVRPSTVAGGSDRSPTPTPTPSTVSEQENRDPAILRGRASKGKGRASDSTNRTSLPTPDSDETARVSKRKRTQAEETEDMDPDSDEEMARFTRYYDPNQKLEARRQVKKKSRQLEREFNEKRNDLLQADGTTFKEIINRQNNVFKKIKQTNDATLDSRLIVNVSNLALKKSERLVNGDRAAGVDVDEFLLKAKTYMGNGGPLTAEQQVATSTQRRRALNVGDDDEEEDDGELDWQSLGEIACFPYNMRPACPSFLLGPLSVEKKQRKQTQRTARQAKDTNTREARPEALTRADSAQSSEDTLTVTCTRIKQHIMKHCHVELAAMKERFGSGRGGDLKTPEGRAWLKRHRITTKRGPHLFDYVVNPHSFGQTVENIFYISFLIKEGHVAIVQDSDGLPVLCPANPSDVEQKRATNAKKHQAVFSLDYSTWEKLIKAFDIKEPMIPHRNENQETQVSQRGWR